jgi:hypothetical protein
MSVRRGSQRTPQKKAFRERQSEILSQNRNKKTQIHVFYTSRFSDHKDGVKVALWAG